MIWKRMIQTLLIQSCGEIMQLVIQNFRVLMQLIMEMLRENMQINQIFIMINENSDGADDGDAERNEAKFILSFSINFGR